MLHVLYLVHDVSDPAVRRRITMLRAGGAKVTLAGFRRTTSPVADIEGLRPIDLGATRDGRFGQRLAAVAKAAFGIGAKLAAMPRPDLII
ncbi:glycosyl transferase family 1, partial [Mesorhizobium sp. M4B.F.Ca.ET.013.02.1.1]